MDDSSWLNRIGITLNFLAGFMLAPELIGLERLNRIEIGLETVFRNSQIFLNGIRERIELETPSFANLLLRLLTAIAIILIVIWSIFSRNYYIIVTALVLLYCALVLVNLLLMNLLMRVPAALKASKESHQNILGKILLFLQVFGSQRISLWRTIRTIHVALLITPFYWLPLSPQVVSFLVLKLLVAPLLVIILLLPIKIIGFAISRLEGEEIVRAFVVWWGVTFFIIGNMLQLIATF
ncbi:MAG: hypothetical protein HYZ49_17380 [Chloroflexi bacterium]|nr:hypothetical protein [Chloroflexota bacterium]